MLESATPFFIYFPIGKNQFYDKLLGTSKGEKNEPKPSDLCRSFCIVFTSAICVGSFNREDAALKIHPNAELGITKVLFHTLQFGQNGTKFDYVFEGGQEILFLYQRYSVDIDIVRRHIVTILYQPLTLNTQTVVPMTRPDGILIDTVTFPAGDGINLKYGFDFWRFSYLFDFFKG